MSQLAQLAQTLNTLAGETRTTPDDVVRAAKERKDAFERVVEELDAERRRAYAEAVESADVVAAARRLDDAARARLNAFRGRLLDVVDAECRAVEGEYDALIGTRLAEVEALREEKVRKVSELLSLVEFDEFSVADDRDRLAMMRQINQLTLWAGKTRGAVVFDSKTDDFTHNGLFSKVRGKSNIALVATTTDGDVFGGFYSVAVDTQDQNFTDSTIFAFTFESHGRCEAPQRFAVKEVLKEKAYVNLCKSSNYGFVSFWVSGSGAEFFLGNKRSNSFCSHLSAGFEGLQDTTLTGKSGNFDGQYHNCTRLVAIELS